ncbi:hypothetical protein DI53_2285 [Sphingobacterium deserti]|uniref:Uncharacterized protein n=1 Tax=Sphingobacterium deserti TaxID=1229276 RepID=A0A0B8T3V0_9SPHI|nr:hypothetical protein DI53_2285 [Sphingobacterium deserti]
MSMKRDINGIVKSYLPALLYKYSFIKNEIEMKL